MLKVIKRNGEVVDFDKSKIETAILKAMKYGSGIVKADVAKKIADTVRICFEDGAKIPTVKQIENIVYYDLIECGEKETAKSYEGFRAIQEYKREINTTDAGIMTLIDSSNEEVLRENSNKNGMILSTQRDLIAGEVSKDISSRKLIPTHIIQAHISGDIHYHNCIVA